MIAETENEARIEPAKGSHGHKPRERRDIASGQALEPWQMIRMAFGPEGQVVPDFSCKLPGRGAWVASDRASVEKALKTKAFSRAAKMKVSVPDDLSTQLEAGLAKRVLGLLGMAKRAGEIETGFDKVRGAAQGGLLAYRFEASDGSEDGRSKIRVSAKSIAKEFDEDPAPVVGCFSATELGAVFGREHLVHVGVRKGRVSIAIQKELTRLIGFRELIPANWTDKEHETAFIPYGSTGGK